MQIFSIWKQSRQVKAQYLTTLQHCSYGVSWYNKMSLICHVWIPMKYKKKRSTPLNSYSAVWYKNRFINPYIKWNDQKNTDIFLIKWYIPSTIICLTKRPPLECPTQTIGFLPTPIFFKWSIISRLRSTIHVLQHEMQCVRINTFGINIRNFQRDFRCSVSTIRVGRSMVSLFSLFNYTFSYAYVTY